MRIRKRYLYQLVGGLGLLAVITACSFFAAQTTLTPQPIEQAGQPTAQIGAADVPASFTSVPPTADQPTLTAYPTVDATETPSPPTTIDAVFAAAFDVLVSWEDQSTNEDGYRVYRDDLETDGAEELIATTPFDATSFRDTSAACGGVYKYTIASYNMLGEGRAPVCWIVRLPECSAPKTVTLGSGAANGVNFATGNAGANGDLYLVEGTLLADQNGQLGVVDLGETGTTALSDVSVPTDQWVRDGIDLLAGRTYAAALRDGSSIAIFSVKQTDSLSAELEYIVFSMRDIQDFSGCGRTEEVVYCTESQQSNVFQFQTVRRTYDGNGNLISETPVGDPTYGPWQPGCPPARPTDAPTSPPNTCPQPPNCTQPWALDTASCSCVCPLQPSQCSYGVDYQLCMCIVGFVWEDFLRH